MIALFGNWWFTFTPQELRSVADELEAVKVDGHIESMNPAEFSERKPHLMPKKQQP